MGSSISIKELFDVVKEFVIENNLMVYYEDGIKRECIKDQYQFKENTSYFIGNPDCKNNLKKLCVRFYFQRGMKIYCGNSIYSVTLTGTIKRESGIENEIFKKGFENIEKSNMDNTDRLKAYLKFMYEWSI